MGDKETKPHIDNDNVDPKGIDNDNDIVDRQVDSDLFREIRKKVVDELYETKLERINQFLFGGNVFISDCGAFLNPAIKQLERFMYTWMTSVSDESKKSILRYNLSDSMPRFREYKQYTYSPLWKYQSSVFKLIAGFRCEVCGEQYHPNHLVVHHKTYEHIGSEFMHWDDVGVVCTDCHMKIHGIRRSK